MKRRNSVTDLGPQDRQGRQRSGSDATPDKVKPQLKPLKQKLTPKTMYENVFLTKQQIARKQELSDMSKRAKNAGGMKGHEMDLAGYMLRLSSDKRTTGGADLDNLRSAHQTVAETRQKLSVGRGNVRTDIKKSNHKSTRQMDIGRTLDTHLQKKEGVDYRISGASTAEFVRAGNCQEHGDVSTHSHATRLKSGQTINTVEWKKGDHVWSELQVDSTRSGRDVILDAWAEGPAVFREDGYFGRKPSHSKKQYGYDHVTGPQAAQQVTQLNQRLNSDPKYRKFEQQESARLDKANHKLDKDSTFTPTSVFESGFIDRTDQVMNSKLKLSELWKRPTGVKQADMPRPKDTSARVDLRNQLRAVGVARALGESVSGAVGKSADIVKAAKKLEA